MWVIVVLSALSVIVGLAALSAATADFRGGSTFRRSTAVLIYAAWGAHAAAFAAAVSLDPYRVDQLTIFAAISGALLGAAGIGLFLGALKRFRSFGQVTGTEVGRLVTSGVYGYSRNPQYTGWIILLFGIAMGARSPLALALVLAVAAAIRIWVPHEEKHLAQEFGEEYLRYCKRVPRFVGLSDRGSGDLK